METALVLSTLEAEAIYQVLARLEERWLPNEIPDNSVWHAYDPLPLAEFLSVAQEAARLTARRRFMDLGCGIGTKLALMHLLGWDVAGVERHRPYVVAARELCPEAEIIEAEIDEVDSFEADLIFMYRPAVDEETEARLESHVVAHVAAGSLLFFPCRPVSQLDDAIHVARDLWRA